MYHLRGADVFTMTDHHSLSVAISGLMPPIRMSIFSLIFMSCSRHLHNKAVSTRHVSLHVATNHWFVNNSPTSCCFPVFQAKTLTEKMSADVWQIASLLEKSASPVSAPTISKLLFKPTSVSSLFILCKKVSLFVE